MVFDGEQGAPSLRSRGGAPLDCGNTHVSIVPLVTSGERSVFSSVAGRKNVAEGSVRVIIIIIRVIRVLIVWPVVGRGNRNEKNGYLMVMFHKRRRASSTIDQSDWK